MRKTVSLASAIDATEQRDEWHTLTFGQLVEHYLRHPDSGNETYRLKMWQREFGHLSAWAITPAQIKRAGELLIEAGYKPSYVNRMFASLGMAYSWIISAAHAPKGFTSPTVGVVRYEEPPRRVFIDDAQRKAIADLSLEYRHDPRFGIFIALLMDCGARRSEISERTWADIDLERHQIVLHDSKNGEARVLHFSQRTADLIRARCPKRPAHELAFGNRLGRPTCYRKAWLHLCTLIGRPDLHLHDLRHDAARRMLAADVSLAVVASALGNGVKVLERRYGHLATADQRRALETIWA